MYLLKKKLILTIITVILISFSLNTSISTESSQNYIDLELIEKVRIKNNSNKTFPLMDFANVSLYPNSTTQIAVLKEIKVNDSKVNWSEVKVDEDGNPYVEIELPIKELNPGEEVEFTAITKLRIFERELIGVNLTIENSGTLNEIPVDLKEKYTKATKLYQVENPALIELALSLKGNQTNVLAIVLNILNWTEYNIRYPTEELFGELRPPSYPFETYFNKTGDCDDQTNLIVTLCRILGIPAVTQAGLIFDPRIPPQTLTFSYGNGSYQIEIHRAGGHGWAMVYIPPWGWVAVDSTYFRGSKMIQGYIRSEDLRDHIVGAAYYTKTIAVALNVTTSDYVGESREWLQKLDEYKLEWKDYVELKVSSFEEVTTTVTPTSSPTLEVTNTTSYSTTPPTPTETTPMSAEVTGTPSTTMVSKTPEKTAITEIVEETQEELSIPFNILSMILVVITVIVVIVVILALKKFS